MLACFERALPCLGSCLLTRCAPGVVWYVPPERGYTRRRTGAQKLVALTIDDMPRKNFKPSELVDLLRLLKRYNAKATFFLVHERLCKIDQYVQCRIVRMIKDGGHEIGVHFPGRGTLFPDVPQLVKEARAARLYYQKNFGMAVRFVRPAGGLATPELVRKWDDESSLTTLIGTAYPFDADLLACLSPRALGRCAADLAAEGGRIAILHDLGDAFRLHREVEHFLQRAKAHSLKVVSATEMVPSQSLSPRSEPIPGAYDDDIECIALHPPLHALCTHPLRRRCDDARS